MRRSSAMRLLPWIVTPALIILVIVVWGAWVSLFHVNPFIFPGPLEVWDKLLGVLVAEKTWAATGTTVMETVVGFVIATAIGALIGIVLGKLPWLEVSVRPLVIITQVAPKVAFIPLFIIWFGFGITSKIVLAALLAFFPVMLNVLLAIRSVDQGHREVMQSLNASKWQTFGQVEFRSLLPYLFAGMEVGITLATIGAIVGEYLAGNSGLGNLLVGAMNDLDAGKTFALILWLSLIGLVLYLIVNELKRFFIPWHESVYGLKNSQS